MPTRLDAAPLRLHVRPSTSDSAVDVEGLRAGLRSAVRGEVRFDRGSRALYATDASNYRQVPIGIVIPRDATDVVRTLEVARAHRAPVFGRGGGTSLAGQCCNAAVALDFSKTMTRVEVDAAARTARVEPGVVLDRLREAAEPHGLTFGPDPATHAYCTLGGMIGNNSCGVHSVMADLYGPGPNTAHSVESLDVVTYRGLHLEVGATDERTLAQRLGEGGPRADLYRRLHAFQQRYADIIRREFPRIPRAVSGYNLPALLPENGFHIARALVGSESTLALVIGATVRLIPSMPCRALVVLGFADVFAAADAVPEILPFRPVGLEGMDDRLTEDLRRAGLDAGNLRLLPEGRGWLLVEFGGDTQEEALAHARQLTDSPLAKGLSAALFEDPDEQHQLWVIRESGLAATAHPTADRPAWPGWEDSAVPPERFGAYLRDLRRLFDRYEYQADLYGHFGQGCLHCRINFDLETSAGIATFRRFMEEAADLVHRYGGSLSGEHGDGQARGELLGRMFSAEMLQAFREFKAIWDPDGMMNPGKLIDARPLDADLRFGAGYAPPQTDTWFRFNEDGGSFARAARRCVGVGKCRKSDAGTMCPSYMVTGEEQHTTRGRARLLFEMLEGDPLDGGWHDAHVHEALDLCLACKGCKGECPVHVDMATYKAEFLAHYYERHWRPRSAWAFGLIERWARLASWMPRLVNTVTQTPGVRALAKLAAGMPQARTIPAFAPQTFRAWFAAREAPPHRDRPRVVLWPDTFNDHFHPETLRAAVEVLERLGFAVDLPRQRLCCGRPLYDHGLLGRARRHLEEILDGLAAEIDAGVPIVGLEPSCLAVFRDELINFFPESDRARRLKAQTRTLAELLAGREDLPPAVRGQVALVHGHCHHKALSGDMDADRALFDRLGLAYQLLDSGCCGMAGSFGFEASHYDVSMAVGERVLLPAVREVAPDALIVADGFSCREQIAQATERRAMHTADVLRMALDGTPPRGVRPERACVTDHATARISPWVLLAAGVAAALAARRWRGTAVAQSGSVAGVAT